LTQSWTCSGTLTGVVVLLAAWTHIGNNAASHNAAVQSRFRVII
jgi:hypothetical protein